jgi:hypothetical protein
MITRFNPPFRPDTPPQWREAPARRWPAVVGFFEFWPKTPGKTPAQIGLNGAVLAVWAGDPACLEDEADRPASARRLHEGPYLRVEGGGEARDRDEPANLCTSAGNADNCPRPARRADPC